MRRIWLYSFLISVATLSGCVNPNDATKMDKETTANNDSTAAMIYLHDGNIAMAKSEIEEALSADPKDPAPWYTLGYFNEVNGHIAEAEMDFKKAIKLNPKSGPAHNNYATFLCHEGRINHAIDEFLTAINSPDYYNVDTAYQNAGICAMEISDFGRAEKYLKKSVALNPNLSLSLYTLALINYMQNNFDTAHQYFQQYLALVPHPPKKAKYLQQLINKHQGNKVVMLPTPLSKQELKG